MASWVIGNTGASNKKTKDFDKLNNNTERKIANTRKIKPPVAISKNLKENDNSIFMDHINEYQDDNAWYIDGNAIDQKTDHA